MRVSPWIGLVCLATACDFDGHGVGLDGAGLDAPADVAQPDAAADTDGDGFRDSVDNCPTVSNDQHDEDADLVGDRCDNCPSVSNAAQTNVGETGAGAVADGAGDACDPFPTRGGNDVVFFDGFGSRDDLWRSFPAGTGEWTTSNDAVMQTDASSVSVYYYAGDPHGDVVVDVTARLITLPTAGFSIGTVAQWDQAPGNGVGYHCQLFDTPASVSPAGRVTIRYERLQSGAPAFPLGQTIHTSPTPDVTPAESWNLRHVATAASRSCKTVNSNNFMLETAPVADGLVPTGRWGLRAGLAAVRFEHVVVYSAAP